jgi:hypothetical protein
MSLANHLTNELTRVYGLPIPAEIAGGRTAYCTTTVIRRASLPDGMLTGRAFPILVHPRLKMAMVLPPQ